MSANAAGGHVTGGGTTGGDTTGGDPRSGSAIASVNPATGQVVRCFQPHTPEEIEARLDLAARAFAAHRLTGFPERARVMRAVADQVTADLDQISGIMTTEMGKTLSSARAEAQKCARACRYFADHAEDLLRDEPIEPAAVGASAAGVCYQPLGPVLAVMPWNFPLWQVIRFAAPAIMAGNVALLKHASSVPQTALYLEHLFRTAGFAPGVFQTLLVGSDAVAGLIADPRVVAVTLTGSTPAGRSVAALAGAHLKPTVLELGGSDPFLVLPSADVALAARTAVTARVQNNGQSCIAAKRFIVHQDVAEEFERAFVARMSALTVGDPTDAATDVGPQSSAAQRDECASLVADAVDKGARLLCGGHAVPGPGFYYPPTVLTDIAPGMRLYSEEAFGPIAQVYRVGSLDEAIALANATPFGLGASVWTSDPDERARCVRDIVSGSVFVNGLTASHPELPFGGVGQSGYGRELAAAGIRAFCNTKTVWVA